MEEGRKRKKNERKKARNEKRENVKRRQKICLTRETDKGNEYSKKQLKTWRKKE
jgi:hypothetical protein